MGGLTDSSCFAILGFERSYMKKLTQYEELKILEARGLRDLAEDLRGRPLEFITEEEYERALVNNEEEKICQI